MILCTGLHVLWTCCEGTCVYMFQLLFDLQKIGRKCDSGGSTVSTKLNYMTDDLQATLERYLKVCV